MKNVLWVAACLVLCVALGAATAGEKYYVVKVTDHARAMTYRVLSEDEYKGLLSELRLEAKLHTRALSLAQEAWKAKPETAKETFPRAAIAMRKATTTGRVYADQAEASAKVQAYQEQTLDKMVKDEERQKDRQKAMGLSKESSARRKDKDVHKERLAESARELYAAKLAELTKPEKTEKGE